MSANASAFAESCARKQRRAAPIPAYGNIICSELFINGGVKKEQFTIEQKRSKKEQKKEQKSLLLLCNYCQLPSLSQSFALKVLPYWVVRSLVLFQT